MRSLSSGSSWALLAVCAIGLVAAWPFFRSPGLPSGTDAELHVYRIAELGHSLQAGGLYPRWAPDFYHGYGYPIFNYYAPLTYYLGNAFIPGHPEAAATGAKACFVVACVVGALGSYLLGRLYGGQGGGLLGSLAYSFAPYIQLVNPHIRGALAETLALACLPWALWSWELVWRTGRTRAVVAAVFSTSAIFLSHNLTGLSAVALVGGLALWHWAAGDRENQRMAVVAGAIFVLVTSFFWLPFLLERYAIKLNVAGEGHYDFRSHFVPWRELLSLVRPLDRRAASGQVPMSVGPHLLLLAGVGAGAGILRRRLRGLGFYAAGAISLLWLVSGSSQWLWELVPGLAYYQFPWRFLGPVACLFVPLIAVLGRPARLTQPQRAGPSSARLGPSALCVAAALLLLILALPGLYPLPWESGFGEITPLKIVETELEGRWRGTTSTDDFVPSTVDAIPGPEQSVLASYAAQSIDRVNRATLPQGTTVTTLPDKPWVNRFEVSTERKFILRLYLFDFPGWHATIDGEEVSLELARPEGYITVPVPEGQHEVVVRFGSTFPRRLGWILTGIGTIALAAVAVTSGWRAPRPWTPVLRDKPTFWRIVAAICAVVVLKALVLDHIVGGWLQPESPLGTVAGARHQQVADLDGQVTLLGYDVVPDTLETGDLLEVTVYWMAQRPITRTYQSFVHLVRPEGAILSQSDHLNPGGFPTDLWPTDRYIIDAHQLRIPGNAAPGAYLLSVGLYTLSEGNARMPVRSAECGARPDSVTLCKPIVVRR